MSKAFSIGLFILIVVLASFLRLYKLGSLPVGLSWDEAAIGYNAFGITSNHRDEYLVKMPISFKSFGDYKAPVAIYSVAVSSTLFGLNTFAIRLPMALAGIWCTIFTFFILKQIQKRTELNYLGMLFVAVSPWNIHFSRIGFETGIATACVAGGVLFFLLARKRAYLLLVAALFFALSMYAYHSTKIAVPGLLLILLVQWRKDFQKHLIWLAVSALFGLALLFPLARESVQGNAAERLYMTSVIVTKAGIRPLSEIIPTLVSNITKNLSPGFLFFGRENTLRHMNGQFGVLLFTEGIGVAIAIILLISKPLFRRQHMWVLLCIIIALIPAFISTGAPHANRALGVIPFVQILAVFGWSYLLDLKGKNKIILLFMLILLSVEVLRGISVYTKVYTTTAASEFQYGYEEAIRFARSKEGEVDKIVMTSVYGQPYIYVLLYKKITPMQFQFGALANYELHDIDWNMESKRSGVLVIGTPKEIPATANNIVKEIRFPDKTVAFRIVQNPPSIQDPSIEGNLK